MLFDESALRERIGNLYHAMKKRAEPRLWRSGKRRGTVRVPGIVALPFTRQQLWDHVVAQIGEGVVRCPYCVEIGRPANLITLANCVLDHVVPITRGGTWELANVKCCCAQCNREKGEFSFPFFIALVSAIEKYPEPDRSAGLAMLRSQGIAPALRRRAFAGKRGPRQEQGDPLPPPNERLALQDNF